MFDPTAFDNLKVVLEGAVYDLDLSGEINIINRKDLFDFANYERNYQIHYRLPQLPNTYVILQLKAEMNRFIAEKKMKKELQAGAEIQITYIGLEELETIKMN